MNRWGVLGKLLPSFNRIVGQMQHDLFHAYTVDQHTLLAIRYLRNFTHSENAHELPLCTELMMAMEGKLAFGSALSTTTSVKAEAGTTAKSARDCSADVSRF